MSKLDITYRLAIIVVLTVFAGLYGCSSPDDSNYVVKVGNDKISINDFSQRYSDYLFSTGISDNISNRRYILGNMIDEIILLKYDDNDKIINSREFRNTMEWRRNETILSFLKDREVYAKLTATDAEVRRAFQRVNEKIAARHIYAPTIEEAEQYYEMLNSGISFENLAREAFTDSTLKSNGGYIGYFNWGEMDPAFEDAAYSLKIGEISKPVKTETGYSIIQVTDRLPRPIVTENEFINNRSKMERAVKIRKKRPSEVEYINNIIDFSKIKLFNTGVREVFEIIDNENIGNQSEKPPAFRGEMCAEYDGEILTDSELYDNIQNMPLNQRLRINSPSNLKAAIKGLYLQDALLEKASELGYDDNDVVREAIKNVRKDLIIQKKISEITYNAEISDSLVNDFYTRNEDFFTQPLRINIQEIIVKDKSTAEKIYSRIKNGEDFGNLAAEYSIRKFSAENSGELGYADVSEFGNLKSTFLYADLNELLGPVEIAGYYGIFKVLDRKEAKKQHLTEVYDRVKAATRFKYSKKLVKDHLNKLYDGIEITKEDSVLASIKIEL